MINLIDRMHETYVPRMLGYLLILTEVHTIATFGV